MKPENKYKKFAFTMAETLLTITILGIIAALMMRSINRINPDKDKVMFLRAFHALESAAGEVVNNTSYYDPDLIELSDLSTDPLPSARVELYTTESDEKPLCSTKSRYNDCNKILNKSNALCYLVAGEMSLTGVVNCAAGEDVMNFRTGNGTCYYGLAGRTAPFEFVIDPSCKGIEYGYAAKIFPSGNMTVPETSATYADMFKTEDRQQKAYAWINEQTDVKKREYDFKNGK